MEEKRKICKDCGNEFTISVGEQNFYAEKGFNEPARCHACRVARKQRNEETTQQDAHSHENHVDFEEMLQKFKNNTVKIKNPRR